LKEFQTVIRLVYFLRKLNTVLRISQVFFPSGHSYTPTRVGDNIRTAFAGLTLFISYAGTSSELRIGECSRLWRRVKE
jgi:hypothetical protein